MFGIVLFRGCNFTLHHSPQRWLGHSFTLCSNYRPLHSEVCQFLSSGTFSPYLAFQPSGISVSIPFPKNGYSFPSADSTCASNPMNCHSRSEERRVGNGCHT